jgi:signal transduction histidine kinase
MRATYNETPLRSAYVVQINIKFEFKATQGSVKKISNEIDYNIFRIVQEFVSNAKKYSQCEKIVCEIKSKKQKSQLIIYDDGIGFDQEKTIKGFGISNIHRRARMINAQISFESEPGNGTRLELVF